MTSLIKDRPGIKEHPVKNHENLKKTRHAHTYTLNYKDTDTHTHTHLYTQTHKCRHRSMINYIQRYSQQDKQSIPAYLLIQKKGDPVFYL